jgi:serine carboxypeptidase-like clade 2
MFGTSVRLSSVLEYKQLDLQIPTINTVGALVKSGIPVLVYR